MGGASVATCDARREREVDRPRRTYFWSLLSKKGCTEDNMRSGTALTI